MNRKEAAELLPIIQAFAEGKEIQQTDGYDWYDLDDPDFMANGNSYRIKPGPKYRPFTNVEECWQEMLKHQPFGWIHVTDDNLYHNIIMLAPEQGCHEAYIRIGNFTVRGLEETFRIATFADGQPFGVKEEE